MLSHKWGARRGFATAVEDFKSILGQLNISPNQTSEGCVYQQKGQMVYVSDHSSTTKLMGLVRLGQHTKGVCLTLEKERTAVLLLDRNDRLVGSRMENEDADIQIPVATGVVINCFGKILKGEFSESRESFGLTEPLDRKKHRGRVPIYKQLNTGHFRIDLVQPLAQGNMSVLEGKVGKGKSQVAFDTIEEFLSESPNNSAVYVGLSQ